VVARPGAPSCRERYAARRAESNRAGHMTERPTLAFRFGLRLSEYGGKFDHHPLLTAPGVALGAGGGARLLLFDPSTILISGALLLRSARCGSAVRPLRVPPRLGEEQVSTAAGSTRRRGIGVGRAIDSPASPVKGAPRGAQAAEVGGSFDWVCRLGSPCGGRAP
jgi:hypothetical protein